MAISFFFPISCRFSPCLITVDWAGHTGGQGTLKLASHSKQAGNSCQAALAESFWVVCLLFSKQILSSEHSKI